VYIIKSLSWHYNDECTIPGDAQLHTAYARREDAERARRQLEREARRSPYSEAPLYELRISEAEVPAWLARFDVPVPPNDLEEGIANVWDEAWHAQVRERLGQERYDEFAQAFFNDEPYYYHVIETELEV
jgi:hypothetical protein